MIADRFVCVCRTTKQNCNSFWGFVYSIRCKFISLPSYYFSSKFQNIYYRIIRDVQEYKTTDYSFVFWHHNLGIGIANQNYWNWATIVCMVMLEFHRQ